MTEALIPTSKAGSLLTSSRHDRHLARRQVRKNVITHIEVCFDELPGCQCEPLIERDVRVMVAFENFEEAQQGRTGILDMNRYSRYNDPWRTARNRRRRRGNQRFALSALPQTRSCDLRPRYNIATRRLWDANAAPVKLRARVPPVRHAELGKIFDFASRATPDSMRNLGHPSLGYFKRTPACLRQPSIKPVAQR